VVEVAGAGVAPAAGKHAVGVAQEHGLAHGWGWVVLVDRGVGVEVEDGPQGDLGASLGESGEPVVEQGGSGGAQLLDRDSASPVG